jgi:hypothetical protein
VVDWAIVEAFHIVKTLGLGPDGTIATGLILAEAGKDDAHQLDIAVIIVVVYAHVANQILNLIDGILTESIKVFIFAVIVVSIEFQVIGQCNGAHYVELGRELAMATYLEILAHTVGVHIIMIAHILLTVAIKILIEGLFGTVDREFYILEFCQDG